MKAVILQLRRFVPLYRRTVGAIVQRLFQLDLIEKTDNFSNVTWLGAPVWQNVLDLWVTQEAISEVRPSLLIECGTNRGGSSLFYAHLFDLLGHGRVITIDIERLHTLDHPRIDYIEGSSTDPEVVALVRAAVEQSEGAVMVILDSDHSEAHVAAELKAYADFVTPGSLLHVQDGIIDKLTIMRHERPGPLPAIQRFVEANADFTCDRERSEKFLITHHPMGWLRRTGPFVAP